MILFFMLPAIIVLGIAASWTDLRSHVIKNSHLVIALTYGFFAYVVYFYLEQAKGTPILNDMLGVVINTTITMVASYMLWHVAIWTAGDAKLFIVFAFLVPISVYQKGFVPFFPGIALLVNTFVPFFIFYFIKLLIFTSKKMKLEALKSAFNLRRVGALIITLFALLWPINLISTWLASYNPLLSQLLSNIFVVVLVLFVLITLIERMTMLAFFKIAVILSLARLLFDRTIFTGAFLQQFIIVIVALSGCFIYEIRLKNSRGDFL